MIETGTPRRRRAVSRAALCTLILLLAAAAPARAEVESSEITSPTDPAYIFEDSTTPSPSLTITGTTTGAGGVDINCYTATESVTVREAVPVTAEKFSVTVKLSKLPQGEEEQPCVLRAVPEGSVEPHPPGEPSPAFKGPRLAASTWNLIETSKLVYNDRLTSSTLAALVEIQAPGFCGIALSLLYAPSSLTESEPLFFCDAVLSERAIGSAGPLGRSEIQVDGQNAFDSYTAAQLFIKLKTANQFPPLTVTRSFDPTTGLTTVREVDPIVECVGKAPAFPPEAPESCESFRSAGVQLERSWHPAVGNEVVNMSDVWRSTDGAAHTLDLLYDEELADNRNTGGGSFEFPGKPGFVATLKGEPVTLAAGPSAFFYKSDNTTPPGGDAEHRHPQGAIVYDRAPSGPLDVFIGSEESTETGTTAENGFLMPYHGTVPAGGTYALRMAFITAFALSEVHSLVEGVIAGFPPTVSIASPANGSTVTSSPATVTGTAADTGAIASVTVNGVAATVAADGSWSAGVPLSVGANTLTATVTDGTGMTSTATGAVTYTPPPPAGAGAAAASTTPAAHASRVGSIRTTKGRVTLTLACTGAAGEACRVGLLLSTTEKLKATRVTGLSARNKVLKLTGANVSIAAGSHATVTLKPNATGRSLLARFGKLPARLAASERGGRLFSTALTIKPPPKHHH
jgi:Glucodextranase, domain B